MPNHRPEHVDQNLSSAFVHRRPPRSPPFWRQGVQDSLTNQTRLLDAARSRRQAAEKTQESVGEDRKRFLAASRDLAVECYRYEALNAHLALMRR